MNRNKKPPIFTEEEMAIKMTKAEEHELDNGKNGAKEEKK